jgi:hypothetical protein
MQLRRTCLAKARRGALGFWARQICKQEYSVEKEPLAGAPCQGQPPIKNVAAAGGRIIIPPYPAANELSGILWDMRARDVDTREVNPTSSP